VSEPQVIDDLVQERVFERVAAIDVAKKDGTVCLRLPHPSQAGARRSVVWTVTAAMGEVRGLAARLAAERVQKVTLESTSVIRGRQRAVRHRGSKMFRGLGVSVAD
jgi:transposase